ncbi:MAG: GGDEF domain-containing protein [Actinomycetota bacterium]
MQLGSPSHPRTAGEVAFARSLSAGRLVVALVAAVATGTASAWREPIPFDMALLVILAAAVMIGREVLRWVKGTTDRPDPSMIIADAAMAVALLAVIGDAAGPLGWIAMVLPVMEALVWSGLVAATLTWISVGGLYVVLRTMAGAPLDDVLSDLVAHFGGSLLIAVPAWAAGSVIGRELNAVDRTLTAAQGRADQIQRLADVGRRLAGAATTDTVLDRVTEAGIELGFTAVDLIVEGTDGRMRAERLAGRFPHGLPRDEWLIADALDRGVAATNVQRDVQALHRCGLRSGVAARITDRGERMVIRLWRDHESPEGTNDREIARTIAGQAAVAWQQASVRGELEDRAASLQHEATHDALTGLANRNGLMAYLDTVAYEMRGQLGLLYIDLDGFKLVNDTLGHDAGDEVLRTASQRIASSVGDGFVARLGGDEFVVVLGVESIEVAAMIGNRIIQRLEHPIETAHDAQISASVGVTLAPRDADVLAIMRAADQSMYAAKRAGGGRVAATRASV